MAKAEKSKPSAPALDAGLSILERLRLGPCGFSEIEKNLNMSRASVARIIKILCLRGYVERSIDGMGYQLGPSLQTLVNPLDIGEVLIRTSAPHLESLREATSCSTVLQQWKGDHTLALDKRMHEAAPTMMPTGRLCRDPAINPWTAMLFCAAGLPCEHPYQVLSDDAYYDDQLVFKQVRRLAVLIPGSHRPLGALVLGGTLATITSKNLLSLCESLRFCAKAIAEQSEKLIGSYG